MTETPLRTPVRALGWRALVRALGLRTLGRALGLRTLVRALGLRTLGRALGTFVLVLSLSLPLLGLLPACAAPTLPLPPPSALVSTPADDGFVTVSGNGQPNALVMVLNENRDVGVIVSSDAAGDYTARIEASIAEIITVWQMVGTDTSQLVSREVPNR